MRASIDRWDGLECSDESAIHPSLDQLRALLDRLDADVHTLLTLDGGDGSSLTIGGGGDQFVIYYTSPDGDLVDFRSEGAPADGVVMLNIGGQEGDYRRDQIADKSEASRVLAFYAEREEADLTYLWVAAGNAQP